MNSTVLKWVGSKVKVMAELKKYLPPGDCLVEPFAGSCAVLMNRHGYRGICRYNLDSGFNVPFEKIAKPYFPEKEIRAFAEKARRATFICAGFADTLAMVQRGDVIYIDPPYDGTFSKYYTQDFGRSEHIELAEDVHHLRNLGYPVVVSNSDTEFTREAYTDLEIHSITTFRSVGVAAGKGKQAAEIVAVSRGGKMCNGCDRTGGGYCPDCGPCAGYSADCWESYDNPIPY